MAKILKDNVFGDPEPERNVDDGKVAATLTKVTKDNVTIDIIMKALTALAWRAGKFPRAIEDMAAFGWEVSRAQLKSWSEGEYAEDYRNIRENFSKTSEGEMIFEMRDIIHQAAEAERLAIEKTVFGLENGTPTISDASKAAYYLGMLKKNNVDKLQTLLGRPTTIVEDRSLENVLNQLVARKLIKRVDE